MLRFVFFFVGVVGSVLKLLDDRGNDDFSLNGILSLVGFAVIVGVAGVDVFVIIVVEKDSWFELESIYTYTYIHRKFPHKKLSLRIFPSISSLEAYI